MSCFDNYKIKFLDIAGGDMSDSEYFGLKGYTSVSRLKLLDPRHGGSPQKYKEGFNMGYNESLFLGTCVHSQILTPDEFVLSNYENKPPGKLGYFVETILKYRKQGFSIKESIDKASIEADYYSGKLTDKRIKDAITKGLDYYLKLSNGEFEPKDGKEVYVLSKKLLDSAHRCISSVNNNNAIQKILQQNIFEPKQYYNEIALFSNIEVTFPDNHKEIVKFKGKLDSVVWDPEQKILYLNDVKTTSKMITYFMDHYIDGKVYEGVFSFRSYYLQLALYSILLQKYFQEVLHISDYTLQSNIFAVETTGEYRSDSFRINNSYIDLGIQEGKQLICRLAWHNRYGFDKEFPEG